MKLQAVRTLALALPEATEAPHFDFASFRVRGKIFATAPPDGRCLHLFVSEHERERALALYPAFAEILMWGKRVSGLRIVLSKATPGAVEALLRRAWEHKAPRKLVAAAAAELHDQS